MFEQSTLDRGGSARKPVAILISSTGQILLVGLLVVVPLLSTSALPGVLLTNILRAPGVPPPPAPPPGAAARSTSPAPPRQFDDGVLREPVRIPAKVALITEDQPPPSISGPGVAGGTGNPGGVPGGVISAVLTSTMRIAAPPPPPKPRAQPKPAKVRRVQVGGQVQPPVLIRHAAPVYPPLAVQTRTSGTVKLQCIIGVDGRVTNIRLISGHPLLVGAAIAAVSGWRYRPTLLNGEPVEVVMIVDVRFQLGR